MHNPLRQAARYSPKQSNSMPMRKRFESTEEDEDDDEPETANTTPVRRAVIRRRRRRSSDHQRPPSSSPPPFLMGFSVLFLVLWTVSVLGLSSLLWRMQQQPPGSSSQRALRQVPSPPSPPPPTTTTTNTKINESSSRVRLKTKHVATDASTAAAAAAATAGLKLAWLMSFPNSGTSYTSQLVREATRTMTATNYADEVGKIDHKKYQEYRPQPVFADQPEGPFWIPQGNFTAPERYVLTKTHCGLRCTECPPEEYAETTYSFRRKCTGTKWLQFDDDGGDGGGNSTHRAIYGHYPSLDRIEKAIHLIRDPFDNVVSRFHHLLSTTSSTASSSSGSTSSSGSKKTMMMNQTQQQQYPATKHGFLEYCLKIDGLFTRNEIKYAHFRNTPALRDLWLVPCHAEFCKYIEWHNLAFHTTSDMELTTLVVHYDDYPDAGAAVLSFLHLDDDKDERQHHPANNDTIVLPTLFEPGKTYHDYFLPSERQIVQTAFEYMASKTTWSHLQRYFTKEEETTTTKS